MNDTQKKGFLKQFSVIELRLICSKLKMDISGEENEIIMRLCDFSNFSEVLTQGIIIRPPKLIISKK